MTKRLPTFTVYIYDYPPSKAGKRVHGVFQSHKRRRGRFHMAMYLRNGRRGGRAQEAWVLLPGTSWFTCSLKHLCIRDGVVI